MLKIINSSEYLNNRFRLFPNAIILIVSIILSFGGCQTNIHYASRSGNIKKVEEYLNQGISANARDTYRWTPLHYATISGHYDIVNLLLSKGASIDSRTDKNVNGLHLACAYQQKDIVELFLAKGADINSKGLNDFTPLLFACEKEYLEIVKILIKNGANANASESTKNYTPLLYACYKGNLEIAKILIENGANVNASESNTKYTPLHYACEKGNLEIAKILVENSAYINALESSIKATPLYIASYYGHDELVQYLISEGSDWEIGNKFGHKPEYIAKKQGHHNITVLLSSLSLFKKAIDENTLNNFMDTLPQKELNKSQMNYVNKMYDEYENKEYEKLTNNKSLDLYVKYLANFPDHPHAREVEEIYFRLAYNNAIKLQNAEALEDLINKYPNNSMAEKARSAIPQVLFEQAKINTDPRYLDKIIIEYPKSKYAQKANDYLPELRFHHKTQTIPDLMDYIDNNPDSPFKIQAKNKIPELKNKLQQLLNEGDTYIRKGEEWHKKAVQINNIKVLDINKLNISEDEKIKILQYKYYPDTNITINKEIENMKNALSAYKKANEIYPNNPKVLMRLGLATTLYSRQANTEIIGSNFGVEGVIADYPKECLQLCNQAADMNPNDAEVYLYRSRVNWLLSSGAAQKEEIYRKQRVLKIKVGNESEVYHKNYINDLQKAILLGYPVIEKKYESSTEIPH